MTYSTVIQIGSDNNGDVFRCTLNFSLPDGTPATTNVDSTPPEFAFTWVSSPPLNVQCKCYVINFVEINK